VHTLLNTYPVISQQVNKKQLAVILRELEHVIAHNTPGDIVEFGCYIGTTSLFIRRLLDEHAEAKEDSQAPGYAKESGGWRKFHVYDSFEGLPAKAPQDASASGEQFIAGELSVSKKQFLHEFKKANLSPPVVHAGWFNELQDDEIPPNIAFAFLDGDFYDSIGDSLSLVLPRMQPGGIIVIDDYAREALPGVARAVADVAPTLTKNIRVEHNLGIIRL
jgi:O-methyltransferase